MPMSAFNGAHTTFPMKDMPIAEFAKDKDGKTRDIVMIVDEAILNECGEPRQMVWFADVTDGKSPDDDFELHGAGSQRRRSASGAAASGRIRRMRAWRRCSTRRWRSSPSSMPACARSISAIPITRRKSVTSFPSITAATDKRCVTIDRKDRCKVAIQTNNVETDERGYVYIVDRANTGLHILELTGPARAVAGLP